jgi:hypothetical protein
MVDAHPNVAITPETHWIARYFDQRLDVTADGLATRRLAKRLLNHRRFPELQIEPAAVEALLATDPLPLYASFVTQLFDLYGQRRGKPLVGDKTPRYVRSIETLHELWPLARFVHLIRDGRDICLSMMSWTRADRAAGRFDTWKEDPVSTSALFWEWNVRLGRRAGATLGPRLYFELRYEALVDQPSSECQRLCEFLGIPPSDQMVRYHEARPQGRLDKPEERRPWLPPTPGLRTWRSQMRAEDIERFEAAVGDLLSELGYARVYPDPPTERRVEAARIRSRFSQQLESSSGTRRKDRAPESSVV